MVRFVLLLNDLVWPNPLGVSPEGPNQMAMQARLACCAPAAGDSSASKFALKFNTIRRAQWRAVLMHRMYIARPASWLSRDTLPDAGAEEKAFVGAVIARFPFMLHMLSNRFAVHPRRPCGSCVITMHHSALLSRRCASAVGVYVGSATTHACHPNAWVKCICATLSRACYHTLFPDVPVYSL